MKQNDPEAVVAAFYTAWLARDVPAMLAYIANDMQLSQHFEDLALPFPGTTSGKDAFKARIEMIFADWSFDEARPKTLLADELTVRASCPFVLRHIATGETFEGTLRHVWRVREDRIFQCDEYLDVARLKAFLRLLGLPANSADSAG